MLLFIQAGDTRPVVCPTMKHEREALLETKSLRLSAPTTWNHPPDRWWLVECESAEDGRTVIMQEKVLPPLGPKSTLGRILASGGTAA